MDKAFIQQLNGYLASYPGESWGTREEWDAFCAKVSELPIGATEEVIEEKPNPFENVPGRLGFLLRTLK